jgi:hypothetical protein
MISPSRFSPSAANSRTSSISATAPFGHRRVVNLLGGTVSGARLNGRVLPGGADWQIVAADGALDIHARYTIESDTGALVQVDSKGMRHGPPTCSPAWRRARTSIRRSTISAPSCASRPRIRQPTG